MANTYNWNIVQLDCFPTHPQIHTVHTVHWSCTAMSDTINSETGQPYQATTQGAQSIQYVPTNTFTSFDNLTHDEVINWVKNALQNTNIYGPEEEVNGEMVPTVITNHLNALYGSLDQMIAAQITPPTVRPALPWSTT